MQLDDLKQAWAAHGAILERSLAINERLLREVMLRRVRTGMWPHLLSRALEVVLGLAALIVVMPILVAHLGEPRYVVAGGALAVYLVGLTALSVYLLVNALQIDFGRAVTAIQRDVERIRRVEYHALTWAVLGGVVIWLPAALVLFEAVTGVDALARADLAWLIANLVFGLAVLAAGRALSRRYVERPDLSPWARRLVDAVSGRALRAAAGHLAELSSFERDEPPLP
jgi:hypothetical protein